MLIAYEPLSDVLTITLQAAPVAQSQLQGAATIGFDAVGNAVSVSIPDASTALWEHGGQVQIMLPEVAPVAVIERTIIQN